MFANVTTTATRSTDLSHEVELILTGFRSFTDINLVRQAVAALPGVGAVRALGSIPGAMAFAVAYEGMVPFEVHLDELLRNRGRALPEHVELAAA
ncbi:MAG: hypothetical protein AB7F65_01660 [Dehalococcoidia bacterium]